MAQSGFTPISLYFSATGAAVPTAGNLVAGELALNTNDGKLYFKNSSGVVTLLAGSTSGPAGGSTTQVQYNNSGVLAGITGATTNGTALTLVAPVLGTPASGTVTNLTGTASININGTVGATTPGTGAFTTLSASSTLTVGATYKWFSDAVSIYSTWTNAASGGGDGLLAGGGISVLRVNSASIAQASSTGLAVTGTLSATSGYNGTVGATTANTGAFTTLSATGATPVVTITGTGTTASSQNFTTNGAAQRTTIGVEQSTGGGLFVGSSAYAAVFGSAGASNTQFATNNTVRATIDTSGNFGLGVTPGAWNGAFRAFQFGDRSAISQDSNTTYLSNNYVRSDNFRYLATATASDYYQSSGQHVWRTAASGTAGDVITFTQAMTLDASGNLLVGVTSATAGSASTVYKNLDSTWTWRVEAGATSLPNGILVKYSGTAPNSTGSQFIYCEDSGNTQRMSVRSNGGIANYSANDVNLSDRREKTNFAPATSYLDKICAIPVQTFNYIDQNLEEDGGLTLGVVAQDVQAVAPELVMESNWASKDEEPKMRLSIYQTDLQYALMKCIQEQQALITQLTARITALETA